LKARLTILQVTSSSDHSGGTRQALLLCDGLQRAGHRVVLCAPPNSRVTSWAMDAGIETQAVTFGSLRGQWRASRRLRALAAREGAQMVHAHHTKGHNAAFLATFGGAFPPVIANRGVLYRPEFPWKFRSKRTAAIITNSQRVGKVLRESGVAAGKIHVVYNATGPADLEAIGARGPGLRAELGLEGMAPVVGAVGSGNPDKGFQHLVEAAPAVLARHPGAVFVLVGPGTERLVPRLEALGLRDRFRLPGYRSDVHDLLGVLDLFVLPSVDKESCPNVLLEAMAVGVPAVASDVGGAAEILDDGRLGWLVSPGRPEDLAAAVCRVLEREDRGRAVGALAAVKARDEFSLECKVEGTLRVYASLFGDRHGG